VDDKEMSEADEMLARAVQLAKGGYENKLAAEKAAKEAGTDPGRSRRVIRAGAQYDAFCEELAHLRLIRARRDGTLRPGDYPSTSEAAKYIEQTYFGK